MMVAMMVMATGCSNDDEPDNGGVTDLLNAIEMLYNSEGQPAYTYSGTPGVYLAYATGNSEVEKFVRKLIADDDWTLKENYTLKEDENGSLIVKGQTADMFASGIYCEVVVNFSHDEYVPYTLQIITEEKAKDFENGRPEGGFSGGGVAHLTSPD